MFWWDFLKCVCAWQGFPHYSHFRDNFSKPQLKDHFFPSSFSSRKCFSSYKKKVAKKTEEKQAEPLLGLESHSQSSVESSNSGLQDGSTHQIKSVQSTDRLSDLVSHKSNCTNNSSFIPPSKRNRPVSAPPGQLRYSQSQLFYVAFNYDALPPFNWVCHDDAGDSIKATLKV